jgi:DNA-binding transcriptional LysR family regulator
VPAFALSTLARILLDAVNTDGPQRLTLSGPLDSDEASVLIDWARDGAGIVNRPRIELAQDLDAGNLVPVLPAYTPPPAVFAAVYPHRRQQDPKIRLLADFMTRECRAALTRGAYDMTLS